MLMLIFSAAFEMPGHFTLCRRHFYDATFSPLRLFSLRHLLMFRFSPRFRFFATITAAMFDFR